MIYFAICYIASLSYWIQTVFSILSPILKRGIVVLFMHIDVQRGFSPYSLNFLDPLKKRIMLYRGVPHHAC